jgi:hypothetical protein
MVSSLLIAVLVLAIAMALIGGWIQPALQIVRSWSLDLLIIHIIVGLVLVEIAVNLVIHPAATVLTVVAGGVILALLWRIGITREPVEAWWRALRTVRRSQASLLRRLADNDIGAYTRRLMDRKKGHIYLGTRYGRWVCAEPEHAVLVLGPPRQGKTSAIVIPTILAASGPLVATSTKEDVLLTTAPTRAQVGRCWLFDPSGTVRLPPSVAPSIQPLRWAPVQACSTWDGAVMIAHNLVATSRPAEGLRDAGHWAERAEALLAPLLHAAALDGLAMRAVMTWVLGHDDETAQAILRHHDAELASVTLAGVGRSAATERAGIWSTAAGTLAAYRSQAALAATDEPNFDPLRFVGGSDTIYIAAPGRHQKVTAPPRRRPAGGDPECHLLAGRGACTDWGPPHAPGALSARRGGQHRPPSRASEHRQRGWRPGPDRPGVPPGPLTGPGPLGRTRRRVPVAVRHQAHPPRAG